MFLIPHFHYHIKEWKYYKKTILSELYKFHYDIIEKIQYPMQTSFNSKTDYSEFKPFVDLIHPYIDTMCSELSENNSDDSEKKYGITKCNNYKLTSIWIQIQKQNQYHSLHNHGIIGWSGVFYAEFNCDVHESTKFYCPMSNVDGEIFSFQPKVKEGDLIIFPSQINHESLVQKSNIKRTIISFNLKPNL